MPTPFLTETELAALLRVSRRTLQRWRRAGTGPRFHAFSERAIRYAQADVTAWQNAAKVAKAAA